MRIFIVLQIKNVETQTFEIAGVFSTRKRAVEACRNDNFVYVVSEMDYEYPIETITLKSVCPTKREIWYSNGTIIKY